MSPTPIKTSQDDRSAVDRPLTTDPATGTPGSPGPDVRFAEPYARMLPRILAVPDAELVPVNLDITSAVATTLGALPEIRALRPRIVEELPRFDLTDFDQLQDIASALSHAHTQYVTACTPPDDLQDLYTEGLGLRDNLRGDAEQLARRGLVNGQALREVTAGNGYKNLARDLQVLVSVLRERWVAIEGRCAVDHAELDRAESVAGRILQLVGLREQGPAVATAATETRLRAFTLFWKTYDDVRRAVSYLRWREGDADAVVPSLYAGRGGRRRIAEEPPAPVAPASGATTPGAATTSAPAAGAATPPATAAVPGGAATPSSGGPAGGPFLA